MKRKASITIPEPHTIITVEAEKKGWVLHKEETKTIWMRTFAKTKRGTWAIAREVFALNGVLLEETQGWVPRRCTIRFIVEIPKD